MRLVVDLQQLRKNVWRLEVLGLTGLEKKSPSQTKFRLVGFLERNDRKG